MFRNQSILQTTETHVMMASQAPARRRQRTITPKGMHLKKRSEQRTFVIDAATLAFSPQYDSKTELPPPMPTGDHHVVAEEEEEDVCLRSVTGQSALTVPQQASLMLTASEVDVEAMDKTQKVCVPAPCDQDATSSCDMYAPARTPSPRLFSAFSMPTLFEDSPLVRNSSNDSCTSSDSSNSVKMDQSLPRERPRRRRTVSCSNTPDDEETRMRSRLAMNMDLPLPMPMLLSFAN